MTFTLPELPFAKDALEPHMSANTFSYHHEKHHAGYVKKANDAVEGTEYADMSAEETLVQLMRSWMNSNQKVAHNLGLVGYDLFKTQMAS